MRIVSVNVGEPLDVEWRGQTIHTGIFKHPVRGPVAIRGENLAGDAQADPTVHGGRARAAYAYPSEHYDFWRGTYPDLETPWGLLGENLTLEGLLEEDVHVGDVLRFGTAALEVTHPRIPCMKLGIRFGRPDVVKRFLASGRVGFHLGIVTPGEVAPGDPVEWISRHPSEVGIPELTRVYKGELDDPDLLRRAIEIPALADDWRDRFRKQLAP